MLHRVPPIESRASVTVLGATVVRVTLTLSIARVRVLRGLSSGRTGRLASH